MNETDAEQLELLDRIDKRLGIDLDQHAIEWTEMPDDGSQGLVVDGGGFDGDNGFVVATHGEDLHLVGPTKPRLPRVGGCGVV